MVRICVIGAWHLGCIVSSCLAEWGHRVAVVDRDAAQIAALQKGIPPVAEPGLERLIRINLRRGTLRYSTNFVEALRAAELACIAYDTPVDDHDRSDLSLIKHAARQIAHHGADRILTVVMSQVPVGTCHQLLALLRRENPSFKGDLIYNPENLRLGDAIQTFSAPDRVIVGANDPASVQRLKRLYHRITAPVIAMSLNSAEMAKHALNAFLATSVSWVNELSELCEVAQADVRDVIQALKTDRRIGPYAFLSPGMGFSGGTLARDVQALRQVGKQHRKATRMLDAALAVNLSRRRAIIEKLRSVHGRLNGLRIGLLGLTYKPGTSTLRRSAALELARSLVRCGACVQAFDPMIRDATQETRGISLCREAYVATSGCNAVILATAWPEFQTLDFHQVRGGMQDPVIVDVHNMLNPQLMSRLGFRYIGSGIAPHEAQG